MAQGLPTELLHPVFGQFLDDCTSLFFQHQTMSYSPQESAPRWLATTRLRVIVWTAYYTFLGSISRLTSEVRPLVTTNGTWQTGPQFAFMAMNIEVKNEIGSSGGPYIQNIGNYLLKNKYAKTIRLPCILVSVAGMTNLDFFLGCFSSLYVLIIGPKFWISNTFNGPRVIIDSTLLAPPIISSILLVFLELSGVPLTAFRIIILTWARQLHPTS